MRKHLTAFVFLLIISCSAFSQTLLTPDTAHIYLRDGKWLAADLHLPDSSSPKPTILIQTPYNRTLYRLGLPLGFGTDLSTCPYNFVIVDWRGFYGSAAAFTSGPNRGNDGYDVVEWIAAQSWSDGKVGTWGPSALGNVQFQTAREAPPALKCICPLVAAPTTDYSVYYQNGCLKEEYVDQLDALGFGVGSLVRANPVESFLWDISRSSTFYPDSIGVPAFLIGGWFDHNLEKMLEFFESMVVTSPVAVNDEHKMLVGPWVHGGSGTAYVGSEDQGELSFPNAAGMSDWFALNWLDHYLRGMPLPSSFARYNFYPAGIGGYQITNATEFPFSTSFTDFYLSSDLSDSGMGYELLRDELATGGTVGLDLAYDPTDPSPTIGGPTLKAGLLQGPFDIAAVESRDDVLIFTTPILVDSTAGWGEAYRINGKIEVKFYIKSDRLDTDFAIRVTDVFPDGKSIILRDDIYRMRFRDGFRASDTSMIDTTNTYLVEYELDNLIYDLHEGHRLRLDITGSNWPRFDRNLNNGGPLLTAGDSLIAHSKIFVNDNIASLRVPFDLLANRPDDIISHSDIRLYPNPAKTNFMLELRNEVDFIDQIEVYDLNGRLMHQFEPELCRSFTIPISHYSPGIYLTKVTLNTGKSEFLRMIKE